MKSYIISLLVLVAILPFQNCSRIGFNKSPNQETSSVKGGEGFDGKLYVSYAVCDQAVVVSDIIGIKEEKSLAQLFREDCKDLPAPKNIAIGDLQFATGDRAVLGRSRKAFDLQTRPRQEKLTLAICRGTDVQVLIWSKLDESGSLFGSLALDDGSRSGPLKLQAPSSRYKYATEAGQSSRFEIALNGSLTYALNGGPSKTVANVTCSTQSPPLTEDFAAHPLPSSTGVPAIVSMTPTSGERTIGVAGTVVDGQDINGSVAISADNVTIRNSKIRATNGQWAIHILDGVKGARIEDCEIDGASSGSIGIRGAGTFLRNNVHNTTFGIVPTADSLIQDNLVHDLSGPANSTYNAIAAEGGYANLVIRHNNLINDTGMNAALMLDAYFAPITGALIENNRMVGGGYTVYLNSSTYPLSGAVVRNNRLIQGTFGYKDVRGNSPVWTGNVDDVTGAPVP